MPIHFSVYYHDPEKKEYLRQVIDASGDGQLVDAQDLDHLPAEAVNGIDVVFLEYQESNPQLDHWIETTAANPRSPAIFLFFQEISTSNLWKALRLGAKECFTFPIKEEDFQNALQRVASRTEVRLVLDQPTQIISFLGCKGGVGTTFLVANVASLLAQEGRGKVLVVDLDLGFSQLNYLFDINPEHTMTELVENLERLDKVYLQSILHRVGNNCYILPAPPRLEEAEIINAGHLEKILQYIRENLGFRTILIDCCHQFDEITLKALELSNILMLVTAQSIPALSNAKKMLEILNLLELKDLDIEVWVNFWDRQNELSLTDVEGFLGKKISGTITCDYKQVGFSINEGRLLVEGKGRHPIIDELKLMAGNIQKDQAVEGNVNSGWKWLQRLWRKK
ncbi:MAG: AAA family ATPase [Thermodesulfobacteriota bacterium]